VFVTTPDQDRVYRVLEQTGWMTVLQARRVLRVSSSTVPEEYARRVLKQLRYLQKARPVTDDIFVLPRLAGKPVDTDMLAAADVMLDLTGDSLLALSSKKPPFKLCFLSGHGDTVTSYGIVSVREGEERQVNFLLEGMPDEKRTVIFLIHYPEQQALFRTILPHYFAVFDGGKRRYFKDRG
jgi:hypothetical protein